jgi:hypothetical protein
VSNFQIKCESYIDKNGKKYIVSGGLIDIERTLYNDSPIELLREHLT